MNKRWLIGMAALGFIASATVPAQTYPAKPIRIISTGGADIVPRLLGQKLTASLGQQVISEERTGAATTIGSEFVAKSAPVGDTPQEFSTFAAAELDKWARVVKQANIKINAN